MNNREIDALVAEKVMGWIKGSKFWKSPSDVDAYTGVGYTHSGGDDDYPDFMPTTDIAAAWQVVGRMHEQGAYWSAVYKAGLWIDAFDRFGYEVEFRGKPTGSTAIEIEILAGYPRFISCAETLPVAICLAALKAVGVEVEVEEKEA